jgi:protein-disulfide isomerase
VDEGIRLGVNVTPAFFTYGQLIVGNSSIHLEITFQLASTLP